MKYRKKPVVIEAIQLTEEVALDVFRDSEKSIFGLRPSGQYHLGDRKVFFAYISIDTLEGKMTAGLGDWIIKGVHGELYPCKPDIFEATYEPVED